MECQHKNIKSKKIEKKFLDMTFQQNAEVCQDCGAYLRDEVFEKSYLAWLETCYREKRDKFQIQCSFSQSLMDCSYKVLGNYPGVQATVLFRALAAIYINVIDTNEEVSNRLDDLLDREILASFEEDNVRKRVNIQFKPAMMLDIVAIAELTDLRPSQIIEESVLKMMTAITSADTKLKVFWEKNIKHYFEVFLKSA